jgi:predicted dinucleotide-binding enzyme
MRIGILGTGSVGQTIGTRLLSAGHEVKLGSRAATNEKAAEWVASNGARASQGTFADAAAFGEYVFNCTSGEGSLPALHAAGTENLDGKPLIDLANPLDFSHGMPATLTVCNTDSLGEQIQRAFPNAFVVKTLNTLTASLMLDPLRLAGDHDVFMSGNDAGTKAKVAALLQSFGWKNIVDLGDITTARGTEMYLPLWLRLYGAFKSPNFNVHLTRG